MGFLSHKTSRTPAARSNTGRFRPRLEALEDRCLLSAGTLDPTFGASQNGIVTGPIQVDETYRPHSVVVQPDGKIVLPGFVTNTSGRQGFAIVRYNSNGDPDLTFNGGNAANVTGNVSTFVGIKDSQSKAIARQSDGKIVAVGRATYSQKGFNADTAIAVVRYNANGSLDTTFGANHNGIVLTNVQATKKSDFEDAFGVAVDGNGKIVVSGYSSLGANLLRYNANGSLDATFNGSGVVVAPANFGGSSSEAWGFPGSNARALAIQPDGKILLVGTTNGGMAVARFTPAGTLDTSFHGAGTVSGLIPPGSTSASAYGVVVQNNGAIVLSGDSGPNLALVRLTSAGQLDATFGGSNTGFAVNSNMAIGFALVQGPNGDLLTAGTVNLLGNGPMLMSVAAYRPDGTPDTTFGTGGIATADLPGGGDRGRGIAIQADGKVVVSGHFLPDGSTNYTVELARFLPPNTKIGSLTANPNPVTAGSSVILSAANILNSNPTSTITNVVFYLDSLGGTPLTVTLVSNTSGAWTYSFDTTGLAPGAHTLYAQAVDSNGFFSDPLAVSLTVL